MSPPRTCLCGACHKCRARNAFNRAYRAKAYGTWQPAMVDAAKARAHLKALPYGDRTAAERAHLSVSTIARITRGATTQTSRATEQAILALTPTNPWLTDATGTTRRLRGLVAIGHTRAALATELGTGRHRINHLLKQKYPTVQRSTAESIRYLYERLSMTPGPSTSAREFAQQAGWHRPLCWDDNTIDDPNSGPEPGCCGHDPARHKPIDPAIAATLAEAVNTYGLDATAHRLNIDPTTVRRRLQRAGWVNTAQNGQRAHFTPPGHRGRNT